MADEVCQQVRGLAHSLVLDTQLSAGVVVRTTGSACVCGAVSGDSEFFCFSFSFSSRYYFFPSMQFSGGGRRKDISIIGRRRPNSSLNIIPTPFHPTVLEVCDAISSSHTNWSSSRRLRRDETRLDASGARRAQTWSRKAGHGLANIYKWRLPLAAMREGRTGWKAFRKSVSEIR